MNLHALRFYIIEYLLDHEPVQGWTLESMHAALNNVSTDISDKSVRTILNGLEEAKILSVKKDGRTKHYYLDHYSRMIEGDEEQLNDEYLAIASFFSSMLQVMDMQDLGQTVSSFQKQLAYVINDAERRQLVSKYATKGIAINAFGLSQLTRQQIAHILTLLRSRGHVVNLSLLNEEELFFAFDRFVMRDTCVTACGINCNTQSYSEVRPAEINKVDITQEKANWDILNPREKNRLNSAHLTIGQPDGGQTHQIVLEVSEEAIQRIKAKAMPLDFDLYEEEQILEIEHECTEDLADWIIGLGTGVKVRESTQMREMVKQRLQAIMQEY